MAKKPKTLKDPLTRAIEARERAIQNADNRIARIQANADEQIAKVEKNKAKSKVLLDALRRGALQP